ncbi:phosphatidylinositol-glycan biosynthesis class X protein [Leguminivora glycinivorella]|uniref:phosphatidylinositol-glycan biosynthesis class X protein n=1 Tax=Leguminivora glycinivorella TaxID=1035111 RepID=UPI00200F8521|nr:phosphatidylinositol-glycan biosynthesis class X protein [Leguminivora glycinivorella]
MTYTCNYKRVYAPLFDEKMLKSIIFVLSYLVVLSYAKTCDFNVKLTQTLRNEGFHRNITYEVIFNADEDKPRRELRDCSVGLDQKLPPGVYANPDELGDLKRTKKIYVLPKNRINIELPAEQSSESSIYVMGVVTDDRADLWVPVHARYHQATFGGGMARNEIHPPRLFLYCPDVLRCDGPTMPLLYTCEDSPKDCWNTYEEIPYTVLTDTLIWEVPVGNTQHYLAVAGATALVIVAGSLYLLKSIHQYKRH